MFKLLILLVAVVAVWGLPREDKLPSKTSRKNVRVTRMASGQNAYIGYHPYQLGLILSKEHMCENKQVCSLKHCFCGAVMIGSRWALTAAHCTYKFYQVDGTFIDGLMVIAGSNRLWTGGQYIQVANVYQHPQYDNNTDDYDISVLELKEDITIATAYPIPLHDSGYVVGQGYVGIATGWGYLGQWGSQPIDLQASLQKVLGKEYCDQFYRGRITDRMVCAGDLRDGRQNVCDGDSGGPFVFDQKLYAIVSWGHKCDDLGYYYHSNYPGVFTRISEESIREFIRIITGI